MITVLPISEKFRAPDPNLVALRKFINKHGAELRLGINPPGACTELAAALNLGGAAIDPLTGEPFKDVETHAYTLRCLHTAHGDHDPRPYSLVWMLCSDCLYTKRDAWRIDKLEELFLGGLCFDPDHDLNSSYYNFRGVSHHADYQWPYDVGQPRDGYKRHIWLHTNHDIGAPASVERCTHLPGVLKVGVKSRDYDHQRAMEAMVNNPPLCESNSCSKQPQAINETRAGINAGSACTGGRAVNTSASTAPAEPDAS